MKRPFLYPAVFLAIGIYIAQASRVQIIYPFAFCMLTLAIAIFYAKNKAISHTALYGAMLFLGMTSYGTHNILPPDHISYFTPEDGKNVYIKGAIIDDPILSMTFYKSSRESFILRADMLKSNSVWRKVTGLVKVDAYFTGRSTADLRFGDEIILEGVLSKPSVLKNPGLFDYSRYLEARDIRSVIRVKDGNVIEDLKPASIYSVKGIAYKLRHKIKDAVDQYTVEPHSGFLKAILVGDRSTLRGSLNESFVKTGTVHILAVSGLNVGLIAGVILLLLGILRVPKRLSLAMTALGLVFYYFIAGANPPIARATVMFFVFAAGYIINRESDTLNSLSFAATMLLLLNPKDLRDPGFQLSFMSIASIIILTPHIDSILKTTPPNRSILSKIRFYIAKSISVSVAAWLGAAPIVSAYFNITSPIAIAANIIIVPAVLALTVLAFIFLSACLIHNLSAIYLAKIICIIQGWLFFINGWFSQLPFAYIRTPAPSPLFITGYYGLIFLAMSRYKKHILAVALLLLNIFIWSDIARPADSAMKITFLDVGQGDSVLVEFPHRGVILVDGGSGGVEDKFDIGRSVTAPYLWNRGIMRLDAIIVTHFHEDHLGGILYLLNNFDVGCVIDNGAIQAPESAIYREYIKTIKRRCIRRITVAEGDEITSFGAAKIYILNPGREVDLPDSNDNSIVFKLEYKRTGVLFCADITSKAMERLYSYGKLLKSDIMKVPHHAGYLGDEDVVKNFLKIVSPEICIISVGRFNRSRATAPKTLNILTSSHSICYKTSDTGAISLLSDGNSFKIEAIKK